MKTLICITAISTFLFSAGCSTSTYLSLTGNNEEQIEDKLKYDEQDKNVGAELTLSLMNGTEMNGELLSIRDSTFTLSTKHSATEYDLANRVYPITTVQNDEIQKITIEGSSYVGAGIGIGLLVGAGIGFIVATTASNDVTYGALIGGGLIIIAASVAGGIIGNTLSNEEFILQEIPPSYDFSLLNPLARYPDEEPEYLRAMTEH